MRLEAPLGDRRDPVGEVVHEQRHQRMTRVLRAVLDVDRPPGGDLPDRLLVVRVERRWLPEQAFVPLLGRGVVGRRDAGEQGREAIASCCAASASPSSEAIRLSGSVARRAGTGLVGELRPVVGVRHQRASVVTRLELPPPQVPRRIGVDRGGPPGDPAALVELDDVVLPHLSPGQRHGEHVADRAHPLAGLGRREIAVAVP